MDNLETVMLALQDLIKTAGKFVLEIYRGDFSVEYKADNSPFTIADEGAEQLIIAGLRKLTPNIPIYGEETFVEQTIPEHKFWLVDPIDGTKAFIRGENIFTVNIALIEYNKPVIGLVYDPQNDELYTGSTLGAFKNNKAIEVRKGMNELVNV